MAWQWRYQLERAPEAKKDGSGDISHDIWPYGNEDATGWIITGLHENIPVPASEIAAALSAGNDGAIIAAYKAALVANLHRTSEPVRGWSKAELELRMENNQAAEAQAALAGIWILSVDQDHQYPTPFMI